MQLYSQRQLVGCSHRRDTDSDPKCRADRDHCVDRHPDTSTNRYPDAHTKPYRQADSKTNAAGGKANTDTETLRCREQ